MGNLLDGSAALSRTDMTDPSLIVFGAGVDLSASPEHAAKTSSAGTATAPSILIKQLLQ